jgi:hypothetical protein
MIPSSEVLLEQLFETGKAEVTFMLANRKPVTLKTLTTQEQLDVEHTLSTVKGSTAFVVHTYAISLLSKTLVRWGTKEFASTQEVNEFLKLQSALVIEKVANMQRELDQAVAKALSLDNIEKTFSQGVDDTGESTPSPVE